MTSTPYITKYKDTPCAECRGSNNDCPTCDGTGKEPFIPCSCCENEADYMIPLMMTTAHVCPKHYHGEKVLWQRVRMKVSK